MFRKNDSSDSHCSLPLSSLVDTRARACAFSLVVFVFPSRCFFPAVSFPVCHSLLCILFILTLTLEVKLVSMPPKAPAKYVRVVCVVFCSLCVVFCSLCLCVFCFFIRFRFHGVRCYCWFPSFRCTCWKKHTAWWNTLYLQEEPFA